ncbi:MAG: glutamine synthetase family protein [Pseudomonadota bacterium]
MSEKPNGQSNGQGGVVMIGNVDLSNVMRGRSFPAKRATSVLNSGLPWVPANVLLSPCNSLPAGNPFGPVGETKLVAVDRTPLRFPGTDELPELQLHLAEIRNHDGSAWPVCPRSCLRLALDQLKSEFGLTMQVGVEHELYIDGLDGPPSAAFSVEGSRRISGFAESVHHMLSDAEADLEQFAAEFGHYQFEIAGSVTEALRAADNAVLAQAAIRDAARRRRMQATFLPKPYPDQPGSGVHLHFSLWDKDGSVTARNDALTEQAGQFVAGIFAHLTSVLACSLSNANSYARLTPSSWVGIYPCLGVRNREAAIRLCPRVREADGTNPKASIEFRLADGTANPYLALAALVHAGMAGMHAKLAPPGNVEVDPATLSEKERSDLGLSPLSKSPRDTLDGATALGTWFGDTFLAAFRAVRENDMQDAQTLGEDYTTVMARVV